MLIMPIQRGLQLILQVDLTLHVQHGMVWNKSVMDTRRLENTVQRGNTETIPTVSVILVPLEREVFVRERTHAVLSMIAVENTHKFLLLHRLQLSHPYHHLHLYMFLRYLYAQ